MSTIPTETPGATPTLPVPQPSPSLVPTAAENTPTTEPTYLDAIYWKDNLQVPVILYHRFLPESAKESTRTKMRLEDLKQQLQSFYDSGYSLVPLEKWLAGDIRVPVGRRPMILTMDDLFFADQIFLEADGTPSMRSGLGVIWDFYQKHPDFGFSASLFYNLGDKYYASKETDTWFLVQDGWQDVLAKTIVWCIEHDALPYNHTYQHSALDQLEAPAIMDELTRNDKAIRKLLAQVHREDLIPRLGNYIALPYGVWPASKGLSKYMLTYKDPEARPVEAVFEAGYYYDHRYLAAPFDPGFDRFHIPRITTNTFKSVAFLSENNHLFPETMACRLGPLNFGQENNLETIKLLIAAQILSGSCQEGIYRVGDFFIEARNGVQSLVWTVNSPTNQR